MYINPSHSFDIDQVFLVLSVSVFALVFITSNSGSSAVVTANLSPSVSFSNSRGVVSINLILYALIFNRLALVPGW